MADETEETTLEGEIDRAILNALGRIRSNGRAEEFLKHSQTVLNLANAKGILQHLKPKGAGS